MRKAWILATCLLVVTSGTAQAQERGFAMGLAGLTFAENTSGLFGATVGVNVTDSFQIVGLYEYMRDVLTASIVDDLRLASRISDVRIQGKIPTSYAGAGVRLNVAATPDVSPYVQFDGGVAKIDPELQITQNGQDITDEVALSLEETNGALALSAGIRANFGNRLTMEAAFKWLNILTDETLKINRVHFGLGVRF